MLRRAILLLSIALAACSGSTQHTDAGDIEAQRDDRPLDVTPAPDVMSIDPCAPSPCGSIELCGPVIDGGVGLGNHVDDDCNGLVDETCRCSQDQMEPCFPGPSDRRNVGVCHDGTATCGELGIWGTCAGAIGPGVEVCDGLDNDCNGRVDDGLTGCATTVSCPAYASSHPLTDFTLDGHAIAPSATMFTWRFECPAGITACPTPADSHAAMFDVHVVQTGRYVVHLATQDAAGAQSACDFPLYVAGGGLRVELDWDRKGGLNSPGVDLDLHVAPIDMQRSAPAGWFTVDDCYYATCVAPGGRVVWSTGPSDTRFAATTDVSTCSGAPPPYGDAWRVAGRCSNPRLDTDDIACDPSVSDPANPAFCFVENVNVDVPPHDMTFRLGVNFYRDHGTCSDADTTNDVTHPRILVNCAGASHAEIGGVDDGEVDMRCADNPSFGSSNWTWLAADVRFITDACGLEDCIVRPLSAAPNTFPDCRLIRDTDDVCMDTSRRVFVRNAGSRPVDAEIGGSF